jgi:7-cyano-7-deazaguanine synthase in queuosine biosynthesis
MTQSEDVWKRLLTQGGQQYKENVKKVKELLLANRGYIVEVPKDEYVIILYSGGMDSTIMIDLVIRQFNCKVILIYFRRDAKNQRWEEAAFDYFADFYKQRFPQHLIDIIKLEIQIPSRVNKEHLDRNRQKYFGLPLRNATMWDNAFAQAVYLSGKYHTTIRTIVVGSIKEDETSVESGILALLSGTFHACVCMGIWYYQIWAPFLDGTLGSIMNKADIIQYALKWQIPWERSRSCFEDTEIPCGKCLACENRLKALQQVNGPC